MKLATQDRAFFGNSFTEKLAKIRTLGFAGLEIDGKRLMEQFEEIRAAVKETGTGISSICGGYRGWIGAFEPEERKRAIEDIGEILKYTAEIGAAGVVAPAAFGICSRKLPPFRSPRSEEEERAVLLDALDQIDRLAKQAGSFLLLEPLNRYEDHMINRLSDAAGLIREGNFSSVKVMADFFHMNIEERDIAASIRETGELIAHVHLADSNRLLPGLGHTDFRSGFQALKEIGFEGYMAIECELRDNPEQAYIESVRFLTECTNR
ncbi:sugar phosphate isomerase/epimerase family protein [Paenibacillus thermotolerans]|uniref:sugar phosphate isomerase/epimerase family protein n=1 Tax=Paenibacillus thermotolerans TaxID=3027807 RepID=UPI002368CC13|nr:MULTISPECIES: sugar phosphate isomerase/epimerase family protein [unclassified Paenibacillus]